MAQLPTEPLENDLAQGQGGPLGMPCRTGSHAIPAESRCIYGLAENDPFDVRMPWAWSDHPGVTHEGGEYRVKRYEDLLAAWQAQEKEEGRGQKEEELEKAEDETAVPESGAASDSAAAAGDETAVSLPAQPNVQRNGRVNGRATAAMVYGDGTAVDATNQTEVQTYRRCLAEKQTPPLSKGALSAYYREVMA